MASREIKHYPEVAPAASSKAPDIKTIGAITGRVKEISGPSLKIENEGPKGNPYRAKGKDQSS